MSANTNLLKHAFGMSRLHAFLVIFLIWAGIYLPGIGIQELKGEEGRRIFPAVTMIETGNWIVPSVGGEFYYSKPPFINWLVGLSFLITNEQSELTARIPSAIAVLCFVTLLIFGRGSWLGLPSRLIGSIVFLTQIVMIEKGRLIEIEAIYTCLTGMAMLWWLDTRSASAPLWNQWLFPGMLLACAMLTKGPLAVILFVVLVISVSGYQHRFKDLVNFWAVLFLAIVILIPLGWGYLASQQVDSSLMAEKMSGQMATRFSLSSFSFAEWIGNFFKGMFNFLPWLVFVPMLWMKQLTSEIEPLNKQLFKGCRLALIIGFVGIHLLPSGSSRYSIPILPLASIMIGWILSLEAALIPKNKLWLNTILALLVAACFSAIAGTAYFGLSRYGFVVIVTSICGIVILIKNRGYLNNNISLSLMTAGLFVFVMIQYALFAPHVIKKYEESRPIGKLINSLLPEDETLYVFKPGYQAFLFYVREPFTYCVKYEQINEEIHYLLLRESELERIEEYLKNQNRPWQMINKFDTQNKGAFYLLKLSPT